MSELGIFYPTIPGGGGNPNTVEEITSTADGLFGDMTQSDITNLLNDVYSGNATIIIEVETLNAKAWGTVAYPLENMPAIQFAGKTVNNVIEITASPFGTSNKAIWIMDDENYTFTVDTIPDATPTKLTIIKHPLEVNGNE